MADFNNRPRFLGQPFPDAEMHSETKVAGFLAMGTWNGRTVSFYRDQQGPVLRQHLPLPIDNSTAYHFDFSTLILGKGFQPVFYRLDANRNVIVGPPGAPLTQMFSTHLLFNIEKESQPRNWLRLLPIHPDNLFTDSGDNIVLSTRGTERCIQLVTYLSDEQELFKVFRYEGELTVNAWETDASGVPQLRSKILLGTGEAGCFMQFIFPDNSFVYYFFPEDQLISVLTLWHAALHQASEESRAIMGRIDDPVFHCDDFCICFTERVTPELGIVVGG